MMIICTTLKVKYWLKKQKLFRKYPAELILPICSQLFQKIRRIKTLALKQAILTMITI